MDTGNLDVLEYLGTWILGYRFQVRGGRNLKLFPDWYPYLHVCINLLHCCISSLSAYLHVDIRRA